MDRPLSVTLDALERVDGPAPPPPTRDGWELVLLENVAYLVDDGAPALVRAHQLLRRHGQTRCRRNAPECGLCPLSDGCAAALGQRPLGDPFAT